MQKILVFNPGDRERLRTAERVAKEIADSTEKEIKRLQIELKKQQERADRIGQLLHLAELVEDKSTNEAWEEQQAERARLSTS